MLRSGGSTPNGMLSFSMHFPLRLAWFYFEVAAANAMDRKGGWLAWSLREKATHESENIYIYIYKWISILEYVYSRYIQIHICRKPPVFRMFLVFQIILLWIVHFVPGFLEFSHKNTSDAHRGQNGFPPTLLRLVTEGFLLMSLPHQEVRTSTWGIAALMFHYKDLRRRWVSIYNKCYTQARKSHQLPTKCPSSLKKSWGDFLFSLYHAEKVFAKMSD